MVRAFLALLVAALAPVLAFAQAGSPPIAARAWLIADLSSGTTLGAQSADDRFEPASLAKLMTAYVAFDALRSGKVKAGQLLRVSDAAAVAPGTRLLLDPGASVAIEDLLKGLVVLAANDAAVVLAEGIAGSEARFVEQMNATARRLGLSQTAYVNASGLPSREHHTTARDVATLAAALARDFPDHASLFATKEFSWGGTTHANRNRLLWIDPTIEGLMAGFTEGAGYGVAAVARRGDRRIVAVVLGTQTDALRASETLKLLNHGFLAWETRLVYRKGAVVGTPGIYKGTRTTLPVGFDRDVWITLPKGRFDGLQATLQTQQPYVAPFARGQKAGIMKLARDNAPLAEIPVVALEDVPVAGFLTRGWDTLRLLFR